MYNYKHRKRIKIDKSWVSFNIYFGNKYFSQLLMNSHELFEVGSQIKDMV